MATTFEQMWAALAPVGRSSRTGGYFRQPFTAAEEEAQSWFVEECARRDLRVERDGLGNVAAWWDSGFGPGLLTGSHLDSVLDGGAYDGPLGVVSGLAAIDLLRERGVEVQTGEFGAMMEVDLVNDGPVTLWLER